MTNKPNNGSHPSDNPQENSTRSIPIRRDSTRRGTKRISIPSNRVGVVIGRNGDIINTIRRQSGAEIEVSNTSVMEGSRFIRRVKLTGNEDEIHQAEELIHRAINQVSAVGPGRVSNDRGKEKVAEQKNETKGTHLDTSNITSIPSAFLQSDNPQENRTRMKTIDIPSNMVGVVTGSNGETINTIRRQSGATIQFHNISRMEGGRFINKVDLNGAEDEIHRAEELIYLICRVIDEFIARGLYVARDATSVHHTAGVPRNKPNPKLQIHGTPEENESARELVGQVSTEDLDRVLKDKGKEKVGDQESKSHDDMAAEIRQTRFDTPMDTSGPSAAVTFPKQEHIDSARQTSTHAPDQPYGHSQLQTGYWPSNPQAGWSQPGAPHMPVPPQQGYAVNPTYQHEYGAQLAYGSQQGYAGSGGYYSSLAPSYAPAVWQANATARGDYPVNMNPYAPYYQFYSWPQDQPRTEAHASEFSQAGSQQGYAGSGGYYSSLEPSYSPAVWPANATAQGGYPANMNPYAPYYQYSWPQDQPRTEAHAFEPSQAGTAGQGHGSLQAYMHPYASDNSQSLPIAPCSTFARSS